jgi:hypothetical protein
LDSIQEAPATLHRQNSVIAAKKPDVVDRKVKVIGRPNIPNIVKKDNTENTENNNNLLNGNAPSQHSRASSINSADNKYKRREVSHMRNRKKQNRISQNSEVFVKMNKLQEGTTNTEAADSDEHNETACLVNNEKVQEKQHKTTSSNSQIQETTVIGYSERDVLNNNLSLNTSSSSTDNQPMSSGDAAAEADDEGANNNSGKKKSSESTNNNNNTNNTVKQAKILNLTNNNTTSAMDSQGGTDGSPLTSN